MDITKYEHACLVVTEQGKKLIIDPGIYTTSLHDYSNVAAVVITHVHGDHFDAETVRKIAEQNPEVHIFGTAEVAKEIADLPVTAVTDGSAATVAPFSLTFYGELHAEIHPTKPRAQNVGVMVNDTLYYPGDSFTTPGVPVKVLALPTGGPWLRTYELIDFIHEIKPTQMFPTHNAVLSDIGNTMMNNYAQKIGGEFSAMITYLKPGEKLSI